MPGTKRTVSPDAEASLSSESPALDVPPAAPPGPTGADTPPPGPPGASGPAAPVMLTPDAWASRKGMLIEGQEPYVKGFHSSAEQLHGWKWHAHNFQDPKDAFTLTEADYDAALDAASQFPAKPAYKPALAPNFPEPIVPEHIAKACDEAQAKAAAASTKEP